MIKSVKFNNLDKLPSKYKYAREFIPSNFTINFSEGLNLIIGKNGSGKSTLLNIIGSYLMCNDLMRSHVSSDSLGELINYFTLEISDGVDVEYDYRVSAFKLSKEVSGNCISGDGYLDSLLYKCDSSNKSSGELINYSVNYMSRLMNNQKFHRFDVNKYTESDEVFKLYKDYMDKNQYTPKSPRFSVLLDEPDNSLDMYGVNFLYNDLLNSSKTSQIIVVLHNPILIYKLSKIDDINIIEMSEGYLDYINKFINSNTKN